MWMNPRRCGSCVLSSPFSLSLTLWRFYLPLGHFWRPLRCQPILGVWLQMVAITIERMEGATVTVAAPNLGLTSRQDQTVCTIPTAMRPDELGQHLSIAANPATGDISIETTMALVVSRNLDRQPGRPKLSYVAELCRTCR